MSHDGADAQRLLEASQAEQAQLLRQLDELHERSRAAASAQHQVAERVRAAFVELTAAARAELEAIDTEHAASVAALRAEADREGS